jgi:HEAT repeat protein
MSRKVCVLVALVVLQAWLIVRLIGGLRKVGESEAKAQKRADLAAEADPDRDIEKHVRQLARLVADQGVEAHLRETAALRLMGLGETARSAIPALVGVLSDPHEDVRMCAAQALGDVGQGDPRAFDALVRALGDPARQVWHAAAISLAYLDSANSRTAAALGAVLLDRKPGEQVRRRMLSAASLPDVILAAGVVGAAKAYLNDLKAALDTVRSRRLDAASRLAELGPSGRPALPALRLAAEDGDPVVRQAAAEALKKVEGRGTRP